MFSLRAIRSAIVSKPWAPIAATSVVAAAASSYYFSNMAISNDSKTATLKGDDQWVDLKLKSSKDLSHNTKALVFELPTADSTLGLTTASALLTKYVTPKGSNVVRPYTPVSDPDAQGEFELVVKAYPDGKMSKHIHELKQGDTLSFKGPIIKYQWQPNLHKEITLIGAGTGITPLYQLIYAINKNPADKTKVNLFYGNATEGDILLKKEIDDIAKAKPEQFKVHYFLDKADPNWKGESGFISEEFIKGNSPAADSENVKVFVCGPPPFYKAISGAKVSPTDQGEVDGALKNLGFSKDQVFKF
ncbi:NADH-cytochrome b5 reductase 2 [Yarrowia sp. B02]|nr:NADH-cytochrome b5 reductase 2 [Yarrowia sp. B02]